MWMMEEEEEIRDGAHSEVEYGFYGEEDAFYLLFEELFKCGPINKKNVYEAMRYLLWVNDIYPTYDKIKNMEPRDVLSEEYKINCA